LDDEAIVNPMELDIYILSESFSLQTNVNPKSIIRPEKPTAINLKSLIIIVCKSSI
jgi:hypothetical protein